MKKTDLDSDFSILINPNDLNWCPEQSLCAAVIASALLDLEPKLTKKSIIYSFRYAVYWLFYEDDDNRPFSLGWCCNHLDLCVETIRQHAKNKYPILQSFGLTSI